jgi:two-component system, chemotaxis family, CheB/CheR fusion protein
MARYASKAITTTGQNHLSICCLSSAAQSYGEHLVAVILTGSGSDGAAGAVDVKNAGGVSLPAPGEKPDDPLRDLLAQVSAQSNIDFRNYKSSTIQRRIGRRMAVTHNAVIQDYADYVRSHPDEVKELVKAFLIKVTGFFRDPEAFEFLRTSIIPELIERANGNGRTVRLWSAGCATGEEAYSLALLVADHLGPDFPEWNLKIFATDLAADAIDFGRRGLYPENVLSDLPDYYRDRFFERIDHGNRVSKALRQAVIFGQQDISRGVPFPRIDLVTCRNLLIYLKADLQQTVLDLFAYSLHHSKGYLFLGKAETARPTKGTFELVNKKWKVYRCVGGSLAFPLHETQIQANTSNAWRENRRRALAAAVIPAPHDLSQAELDITQLRRLNETMLRYTNVAVVIIDRQYRILTINAAARRLLGVRDVAYDQDFLHTVRGLPYQEVRRAIDSCFREHASMNLPEIEMDQTLEGSGRYLSFTIMHMQVEQGAPELAVITALDVTEQVQIMKRLEAVQREHAELVGELSAANKRFGTMNKELQDANEELQAANEELMLTQEELQATNEEFEATNEELQATNEELETNNEELQATNEELQTTNDELTARTMELQELTKHHRLEQLQLASLLERFPHYMMVLNAEALTVQAVNQAYRQLMGEREVTGLTISEIFSGKQLEELTKGLRKATREAQAFNTGAILASIDGDSSLSTRFVHTIVPISDGTGATVTRLFLYSEKAD